MRIPVLHQTDIYHPHIDADDHFDLACQYAFAYNKDIELKGIIMDYPLRSNCMDPAIGAVSQLNYSTCDFVPFSVGSPKTDSLSNYKSNSVEFILKTLEQSPEAVAIHIVGSSRDVAAAGMTNPELFKMKCKAIYLNAGSSIDTENLEYNVALDPASYSGIFKIPCPIYWMPCFEGDIKQQCENPTTRPYSTLFSFKQSEIFPFVSDAMKKYFTYALSKSENQAWLTYLTEPLNESILQEVGSEVRKMWSTAGIIHGAGKTVTNDGKIVSQNSCINPLFSMNPIEISCEDNGIVQWEATTKETNRFIFKINNTEKYKEAMTNALKELLCILP